ncbi:MAG: hypothetical protein ACYC25_10130 [Paludibacter sp.]
MTRIEKNLWRERWFGCINELTSFDLQRKSWLDRTQTNPHWSFVEFMCSYFDDLVIDENYKYPIENELITRQEYEIIKDWHEALNKYNSPENNDYDNEAILKDPKWLDILQTGVNVRNNLAKTLNETEIQFLTKEIDYLKFI